MMQLLFACLKFRTTLTIRPSIHLVKLGKFGEFLTLRSRIAVIFIYCR